MNKKALSLPILISLVVGNMIGTGIYLLPASLAQFGTISLAAWLFTSVGALLLALTFAHLNHRFPQTGGPYVYCKKAYGRMTGFIVAYTYWISNMVSIAGIAVSSISYLGFISPHINATSAMYAPKYVLALELGALWLFTLVNIIGIHAAGVVQLVLTILKLTPLFIVTFVGMGHIDWANFSQAPIAHGSTISLLGNAAALTFWAFIGLETATVPAENTEGSRDIYRATVFGTLLTAFVYLISTFVLLGMIPNSQLQSSQFPFATAGVMLFGSSAAVVIAICAVLSGLGSLNASILVQGQIVFAAARDELFPHRFAKLSKHDVPVAGQLLSSILISIFMMLTIEPTLLKQFNDIALLAGLTTLIVYFVTALAELKFLLQEKLPLYQLLYSKSLYITLLACAYSSWTIANFEVSKLLTVCILIALAIPVYFVTIKNRTTN